MKKRFFITMTLMICIVAFCFTRSFAVEEIEESSPPIIESGEPVILDSVEEVDSDIVADEGEDDLVIESSDVETDPVETEEVEEELITPSEETSIPSSSDSEEELLSDEECEESEENLVSAESPITSSDEEVTPTIGARSATDENGNVFLGGNYLEVGISESGSFGTSTSAPEDFNSHASGRLGLILDGDGWDVGNDPTTGDFFLPGSPEERYGIAYELNGITYEYFGADRAGDTNITAYTTDDSDIENGILKATVHATTPHNVLIENTYSFGVNDKFYRTEVKIINNSGYEISNVRFFRSFDPDQDADIYSEYYTYNKVICNPDSSIPGGENNFAMVVARGGRTLEGFFLVSFDNRARASEGVAFAPDSLYLDGLWEETTESLPTYSTDESLQMTFSNKNGYRYDDTGIAITFNLGTLANGETTEFSHFSSLDPDVIDSLNKIKDAIKATVDNTTDNTLTIVVEEGYEYSIDGGQTWSTTGVFEGLTPGTEYTVLTRPIDGTEEDTTEIVVSTKNSGPDAPDVSEKVVTENSVIVTTGDNLEYSIDGGETWQDEPEFTGLEPNTEYSIIARVKGTDDTMPGKTSTPITFTTLEPSDVDLEGMEVVVVSVGLEGSVDSIKINKGSLFSAIGDDEDLAVALEEGQNIEIKFLIDDSTLSDEEVELINSQLTNGEIVALTVDISIELYIDNEYVKNITDLKEPVSFTLTLPESILEGYTNFAVISTHRTSSGEYIVTKISDEDSIKSTITISGKTFSNYTIVSEKETTPTSVAVESNSIAGETVTFLSPKTGDEILIYVVLLAISIINLTGLTLYLKRK